MEFFVYILFSDVAQKFYIGQTNSVPHRLTQHNSPRGRGWTARHRPWKLVHVEKCADRSEARKKERYLKSLKNQATIRRYIAGWSSSSSSGS
ncbi:MAG TPA: GIY-YIG nuclease family protein [Candidatus Paceibacterota bacterium]